METSTTKLTALLLISMFFMSSASPILDCVPCGNDPSHHHKPKPKPKPKPKTPKSPPTPITRPPVTLPPTVKPPVTLPPIIKPPVILPPIIKPPVPVLPPVKPNPPGTPCPPPPPAVSPPAATCPIDALKLGACVDLLGGLVHIGLGDPAANECCPILGGLLELEAAVCLCTTLRIKLLNINIILPLALQLLITCGKTPPPGCAGLV